MAPSLRQPGVASRYFGEGHTGALSLRARDEFIAIAIASHELRTPLTSLILHGQRMERTLDQVRTAVVPVEKVRALVTQTERQTRRLARLVDDTLDVGRIHTGNLTPRQTRTELGAVAREAVERLQPEFEAAQVPLELEVEREVPVMGDPDRLEHVVVNLLTNALRYGEKTTVRLHVSEHEGRAQPTVADSGRGVAREDQARIFERFERAVSANEVSGLGLGLYISRQIVQSHGGDIHLQSDLGRGARFIVTLPLAR